MKRISILAAGVALCGAAAPKAPAPVATYWMDVATASGLGAGMGSTRGSRPDMEQVMSMMRGGSSVAHTLDLRLASKQKPAAAPKADHWIPPALQMGPSLPLVTPVKAPPPPATPGLPGSFQRPQGRMLIYSGCGEHVPAGQPTVVDFAKLAKGQVPPAMAAMGRMHAVTKPGPTSAPGFGEWPNERDPRPVPPGGSLLGAHKVEANYAPPIGFTLGQDFMPALGLTEAGTLPSSASRLRWQLAPPATGYALAMFGANRSGEMIIWTSGKAAAFPAFDFLTPAEVKRQIAVGAVLPPSTSECLLPAEVAAAAPTGMVMMIGYGPEANFAEKPKAPKWTAKVRYKTTASLMRGLANFGEAPPGAPQAPQPQRKRRPSFGDLLGGIPR